MPKGTRCVGGRVLENNYNKLTTLDLTNAPSVGRAKLNSANRPSSLVSEGSDAGDSTAICACSSLLRT